MFTILIATDYSKSATNAIRCALQLTKKIPCKMIFFRGVIIPTTGITQTPVVYVDFDVEAAHQQLEEHTNRIFKSLNILKNPRRVSYVVTEGFSSSTQILDAADRSAADLIVMGSRAATGMKKILFGSTTADVIANSKVPVLAVPESYHYSPVKKILHASDLKNLRSELSSVLPLAKVLNATVEVAHITDTSLSDAKLITSAQRYVKSRSYKRLKLYVKPVTFGKNISQNIMQLTKRHHHDMLIMFRHKHNWLGRWFFTSKTESLAHESQVPILAFNHDA